MILVPIALGIEYEYEFEYEYDVVRPNFQFPVSNFTIHPPRRTSSLNPEP
jgi:hypothetical protein